MTAPAMSKPTKQAKAGHDLVDRIIIMLCELQPAWRDNPKALMQAEAAVRAELGGREHWVRSNPRPDIAREVLMHFNGCNATEVARRLGISRVTVWRVIRQAGLPPR